MAKAIVGSNPTLSVCNTRNEVGAGLVPAHILLRLHFNIAQAYYAPVAQWIRASDYGSEGQGFESSQALQKGFIGQNLDRDRFWMRHALELAQKAAENGEVPVGAILVRGDVLIAEASNLREQRGNPIAHAEMLAIQAASQKIGNWRFTDTTLYVTLEPCPMCAGAIVLARIPKVVYGATDPKSGAAGTLYNILQDERLNHRVEVASGVLAEESSALLKSFFQQRRH